MYKLAIEKLSPVSGFMRSGVAASVGVVTGVTAGVVGAGVVWAAGVVVASCCAGVV